MGLLQVWVETTLIVWHVFVSACCLVIVTHRSAVKPLQQRLPLAVATAAGLTQHTPLHDPTHKGRAPLTRPLPLSVCGGCVCAVLGLCVSLCVLSLGQMGPSVLGCWIGDAFVESQLATLAALVLSAWVAMCSISIRYHTHTHTYSLTQTPLVPYLTPVSVCLCVPGCVCCCSLS